MVTNLENEYIFLSVKSKGAEMCSLKLKKDDTQYVWQGDPTYWVWQAPVCFPIVGILANEQYKVGEKAYHLTVHGFARDLELANIEEKCDRVIYRLLYNEQTFAAFPYKFQLDIGYFLEKNRVKVEYRVKNLDNKPMYFSIGAHTGFRCPILPGESFNDYDLIFEQKETVYRYFVDNGLLAGRKELLLQGQQILPVSQQLFENDVLVFKDLKSKVVSLKSRKSGKGVTVYYEKFPYLGIWTKPTGAPFICIEPWCGLTDSVGESKQISEKEGIVCLAPSQEFQCAYVIVVN